MIDCISKSIKAQFSTEIGQVHYKADSFVAEEEDTEEDVKDKEDIYIHGIK